MWASAMARYVDMDEGECKAIYVNVGEGGVVGKGKGARARA